MMFQRLMLAGAALLAIGLGSLLHAQQITTAPQSYRTSPGYVSGRYYAGSMMSTTAGTAVGTLDTVVYLLPFIVRDQSFVAASINARVATGAANCAAKFALWLGSATTKRPTGVPVAGSNTGQSCATNGSTPTVAISRTLAPGVYWTGIAVTTGASSFVSAATADSGLETTLGRAALGTNTNLTAITAPYAYAGDIMALDLTAATFTDVLANGGAPVIWLAHN